MERIYSTAEDIIADEQFQAWYFRADEDAGQLWGQRIAQDAGLAAMVNAAKTYLDSLHWQEGIVPEVQVEAAATRLNTNLDTMEKQAPAVSMKSRTNKWWWAAAAVLIIGISGILLWTQLNTTPASLQTTFGEIREQQLPDGSRVVLNANSEISYQDGWKEGKTREIWLKGEAFFHVTKTPNKSRFIVHTDQFDVVVTGTQFNVMNRAGKTNVMLTEGSVTLHTRQGKEIIMKPGDFVEFTDERPQMKAAREENVLAWKDKKLYFEKTPLHIAVQRIEELYGVTITLANSKIGEKPISGIMPNDNLDILLQALEATTEFHVTSKNNEIIITE